MVFKVRSSSDTSPTWASHSPLFRSEFNRFARACQKSVLRAPCPDANSQSDICSNCWSLIQEHLKERAELGWESAESAAAVDEIRHRTLVCFPTMLVNLVHCFVLQTWLVERRVAQIVVNMHS